MKIKTRVSLKIVNKTHLKLYVSVRGSFWWFAKRYEFLIALYIPYIIYYSFSFTGVGELLTKLESRPVIQFTNYCMLHLNFFPITSIIFIFKFQNRAIIFFCLILLHHTRFRFKIHLSKSFVYSSVPGTDSESDYAPAYGGGHHEGYGAAPQYSAFGYAAAKLALGGCPGGWTPYNKHCYFFSRDRLSWWQAEVMITYPKSLGLFFSDLK